MVMEVATAVGVLKLLPELVEVGKDVWKKLRPVEKLAVPATKDGISGKTYYSGRYRFTISVPDDNWQFWEPTPQFIAALGPKFATPTVDVPVVILSKQVVRLFRPNIMVIVEDVGSLTNIDEIAILAAQNLISMDSKIGKDDLHISNNTNSAVLIATRPFLKTTLYQVEQIYIYASKSYHVTTSYVPVSDDSPSLFGGLQDIVSSFQLIR